jgi:chromatin remodeling complex protein RSC6
MSKIALFGMARSVYLARAGVARCAPRRKMGSSMPTNSPEKKASGGKPNALQKPLQPSKELAAVVGPSPLPRGQVVSKIWEYIRANNLQNPENRREILADNKLRKVFGKDKVTMFEMNKHLTQHLK